MDRAETAFEVYRRLEGEGTWSVRDANWCRALFETMPVFKKSTKCCYNRYEACYKRGWGKRLYMLKAGCYSLLVYIK